ncbi:GerMN domain-containing protein [Sinobaca sp. H24]|uniref:GerMN domain-containing protein n=1 Tax=Sinobaca sp. H24 TaxID=2923376 RepID=UPI00207ACA2B|nr:GerMN domain-containing protein [Sinobaca sp. H24]
MKKMTYLLVPSALSLLILSACGTSSGSESEQAPADEANSTEETQEETAAEETESAEETETTEEESAASEGNEPDAGDSAEPAEEESAESGGDESSANEALEEAEAQEEEETTETETSTSNNEESREASDNRSEEETSTSAEEENTMEETDEVTETVTLYFSDDQLMETLTEERSVTADSEENLPAAALQAWIAGPDSDGMFSPVNPDTTVQSVEGSGSQATVSFSSAFVESNVGSSGDAAIMNQIASIMSQFGYSSTQILIDGEVNESIFGHVETGSPIEAN